MAAQVNEPFQIQGPTNLRELGGYPAKNGMYTKRHVFLRSDALNELTNEGEQFLYDYGLRLVVDLRNRLARLAQPDHVDRREIRDVSVPLYDHLFGEMVLDDLHLKDGQTELTMEDVYRLVIDKGEKQIRKVLSDLISCDSCALFHCTAGKDRTGIIAMLLLSMAGVPEAIIVADYAESGKNESGELGHEEDFAEAFAGPFVPRGSFTSKPEVMEKLISYIQNTYGSVDQYVRGKVELAPEVIQRFEGKFLTAEEPAGTDR